MPLILLIRLGSAFLGLDDLSHSQHLEDVL